MARRAYSEDHIFVWIHPDDMDDENPTKVFTRKLSGEDYYRYKERRTVLKRNQLKFAEGQAVIWALKKCIERVENIITPSGEFLAEVTDREKAIELITHITDGGWLERLVDFVTAAEEREVFEDEVKK